MLSGAHHLLALAEVQLSRCGEDHGVGALDAFREVAGVVRDAVLLRHLGGLVLVASDERDDLDIRDALQGIEMLLTECPLAGNADLHAAFLVAFLAFFGAAFADLLPPFCKMMCPTAVFDAGTV